MPIVTDVADDVTSFFIAHAEEGMRYFSQAVYAPLIAQAQDTLLVRVAERFDFSTAEHRCQAYRLYAGKQGQEAIYTVGQLLRMLLIKHIFTWSLRQTSTHVRMDLLVRWFCGFGLGDATPAWTTLQRFEEWLADFAPRLLFDTVLRPIEQDFPNERQAVQIGDTFALRSTTADLTLIQLLRRTGQRLWDAYLTLLPGREAPLPAAQALYTQAQGSEDEAPAFTLDPQEREERAVECAQALSDLWPLLDRHMQSLAGAEPSAVASFQTWRQCLEKIVADEFVRQTEVQGEVTVERQAVKKERGSYRMLTPVDPDITLRVHDDQVDRGYNISLAATTEFVREIAAASGATPDSVGVDKLIAAQKEHLGVVPPKLIYDRAAGTPKKFADVARASDNRTHLVARLVDYNRNRVRYGPLDFILDEQGVLTCPWGQTTVRAYRSHSANGRTYRFLAKQCQGCPLIQKCRGDKVKPDSYRQVFISSYQSQQRAALLYMQTEDFKADMKLRPHIERIIACLVRYNGARYTQGYGLVRADFQVKMAATAYNLKHWLVLTLAQERAQRVRSASP